MAPRLIAATPKKGAAHRREGTNSYYEQPRLASFMGRFNYTYADRYVLTLNARTDASSKFGANHKWGFFPSISAAWVVSEEKFMKHLPVLDNFVAVTVWRVTRVELTRILH